MAADAFDELLGAFSDYFADDSKNAGAPIALTSRDARLLNAFEELLCAVGPYFDDLDDGPAFHRFAELPPELRFKVYEQYFIDNNRFLACFKWPIAMENLRYRSQNHEVQGGNGLRRSCQISAS